MEAKLSSNNCLYRIFGEGPLLVLVNAWLMSSETWRPFGNALARHYKVLMFDFPNQGEAPSDLALRDWRDYSRALLGLLDELGVQSEDVVVCGISSSADLILRMAIMDGVKFRAAALIAPWPTGYDAYALQIHELLQESLKVGGVYGCALAIVPRAFSVHVLNSFPGMMRVLIDGFLQLWKGREDALKTLLDSSAPLPLVPKPDDKIAFDFPVLIVEPEDDRFVPRHSLERWAERIGAHHVAIQGGHTVAAERPFATAKLVAQALSEKFGIGDVPAQAVAEKAAVTVP